MSACNHRVGKKRNTLFNARQHTDSFGDAIRYERNGGLPGVIAIARAEQEMHGGAVHVPNAGEIKQQWHGLIQLAQGLLKGTNVVQVDLAADRDQSKVWQKIDLDLKRAILELFAPTGCHQE